jgi:nitrogen fixation/metabolism regulation signal transduction histidine kinase
MHNSGFIQKVYKKIDKLDVAKIRQIISELSTEKELYKLVFDSLIEGVIVTNKDNKVILANRTMEEFISIPIGRIYSREIGYCNFDPEIREVLDEALTGSEKVVDSEIHLGRTDQRIILSVLPLLGNGEAEGHVIIFMDITEKRVREMQLRQAEGLAALTTLSAGVAPAIKNPLTSIDIHIQLMKKEIAKLEGEETKNMSNLLVIVKEEVDRLNSIVQDFLFAVRPMSMSTSMEDINEIVKEMAQFLQYEVEEQDIEFVLDLDEDLPRVLVDPKYLKQAFLNVIKNAIEAIHGKGEIHIKTESTEEGDVAVQIMDNGEGIPECRMGKIYDPYFTTKKFGSGLGLVIVYKIIKELGGTLKVKSKEGVGTRFSIELPILEKKKKLLTYEEKDESKALNR